MLLVFVFLVCDISVLSTNGRIVPIGSFLLKVQSNEYVVVLVDLLVVLICMCPTTRNHNSYFSDWAKRIQQELFLVMVHTVYNIFKLI